MVPPGTNSTDQLSPFREQSLSQMLTKAHRNWTCATVIGEMYTYSDDVFASKETIACNTVEPASFMIEIDCTGLQLSTLSPPSGAANVIDASYWRTNETACTGRIQVVVLNTGIVAELFRLENGVCHMQPSSVELHWATDSEAIQIFPGLSDVLSVPITANCTISSDGYCTYMLTWSHGTMPVSVPFSFVAQSHTKALPPPARSPDSVLQTLHFSVCFSGLDFSYFDSPVFDSSAFIER
jgi:hypothetical protein